MRLSRRPLTIILVLPLFATLVVAFAHGPSSADAASCVPPGYVDGLNTPSCPPAAAVPAVSPASAQLPVPTGIAIVPAGGGVQPPAPAVPPAPLAGGQPSPVTAVGDTAAVTRPQQPQVAVRQPPSVLPATGAGRGPGGMDISLLATIALGSGLLLAIGGTLVARSRVRLGAS